MGGSQPNRQILKTQCWVSERNDGYAETKFERRKGRRFLGTTKDLALMPTVHKLGQYMWRELLFIQRLSSLHRPPLSRYHDWEHFSSIRNLRGPHAGLPCVSELAAPDTPIVTGGRKSPSKSRAKAASLKVPRGRSQFALSDPDLLLTPSQIPLPGSRSPSPRIIFPSTAS